MFDNIDLILVQIRNNCFHRGGHGFDIDGRSFTWWELYRPKKKLFGYVWEQTSSSFDSTLEEMKEFERVLKKLPNGISYSKQDTGGDKSLPKDVPQKELAGEYIFYSTKYIIHVSDAYSKKIVASSKKSKTFISNDNNVSKTVISQAKTFKARVQSKYMYIVKDMYEAFEKGNYCLNSRGIGTNYDGANETSLSFSKYEMKNMSETYQVLGFALAITEYGAQYLQDTEFFSLYVESKYDHSILISIVGIKQTYPNSELNDW